MAGADDAEVAKLAAALKDAKFRESFASYPDQALKDRNIDQTKIQKLVDALKDTSKSQLEYLASVRDVLTAKGHSDRVKAELV